MGRVCQAPSLPSALRADAGCMFEACWKASLDDGRVSKGHGPGEEASGVPDFFFSWASPLVFTGLLGPLCSLVPIISWGSSLPQMGAETQILKHFFAKQHHEATCIWRRSVLCASSHGKKGLEMSFLPFFFKSRINSKTKTP